VEWGCIPSVVERWVLQIGRLHSPHSLTSTLDHPLHISQHQPNSPTHPPSPTARRRGTASRHLDTCFPVEGRDSVHGHLTYAPVPGSTKSCNVMTRESDESDEPCMHSLVPPHRLASWAHSQPLPCSWPCEGRAHLQPSIFLSLGLPSGR
jgi:hypothetical protein